MKLSRKIRWLVFFKILEIKFRLKRLFRDIKWYFIFDFPKILRRVKDIFKIGTYYDTLRCIAKLKKETDFSVQIDILDVFLNKLKNKIRLTTCTATDPKEFTSIPKCISGLDYFSDRWNMQRINRIYAYVEHIIFYSPDYIRKEDRKKKENTSEK